jgi:hypothetical protein
MNGEKHTCFFVMPFRPELNFVYLYLRAHLEKRHSLTVLRGDNNVLTIALLEKIRSQILAADVIVADITGQNPNVFYELGYAHAFKKPVILLTQDPPEKVPVDVRQFEVISYDLADERNLIAKLDNAVHHLFVHEYEGLYQDASELLRSFNISTESSYEAASNEEFQARVVKSVELSVLPEKSNSREFKEFLLPKILKEATDIRLMQKVMKWIADDEPAQAN